MDSDRRRTYFYITGFLLSPSVRAKLNVWRYFNLGIEAGYRFLGMKDNEHYFPDQIIWGWEGRTLDFYSIGLFANIFIFVKMKGG